MKSMESIRVAEEVASRLKGRVPEYAVLVSAEKSVMLKLANGEATVTQSWNGYTVTVYVADKGRLMVSSVDAKTPGEAVEKTATILGRLRESPLYAPLPEPTGSSYEVLDDKIYEAASTGDMSRIVEDLELDQVGNAAGMVLAAFRERSLVTSTGAKLEGRVTEFNGYIRVFQGDDASGQWSWVSTAYDPVTAKKAVETAKRLAEECARLPRRRVEPGEYRVLLSPMVAGNLLESVVRAATGGSIVFGFSFITPDKVGERIASEKLTIIDAPRSGRLPGYSEFDDEGIATYDKPIIRHGVLENILHNSKTAKLLGGKTTGNAGILMPRPFNILVSPGSLDDNDMLEALGDGLYATNNWYTRFQNPAEGLFSTVTRDALFIVENGRPVACSPRVRLTGTLPGMISAVEDLGKTLWPIKWWEVNVPSLLPHVLVSKIGVTSE